MPEIKMFRIITITALLFVISCQQNANNSFVPALQDVPLPKGFITDPGMSSFFDSPEGRIAEVSASGTMPVAEVEDFYAKTLPQLGWKRIDDLIYIKEGELLGIDVTGGEALTSITYSLKPGFSL